jgi:hypothetical protein
MKIALAALRGVKYPKLSAMRCPTNRGYRFSTSSIHAGLDLTAKVVVSKLLTSSYTGNNIRCIKELANFIKYHWAGAAARTKGFKGSVFFDLYPYL